MLMVWTSWGIFTVLRLISTNSTNRNWQFWNTVLQTVKCLTSLLINGGTYLSVQLRFQVRVQLAVPRIWVFGQEQPGKFWCPQISRWGRSSEKEGTRAIRKKEEATIHNAPVHCAQHFHLFWFLNGIEEIFWFHLYLWSHMNETTFTLRGVHNCISSLLDAAAAELLNFVTVIR